MLRLRFDFPAGRYHATPWGHHVNEGLVEWPPSPWRILRALLATGYTKLGWHQAPDEMRRLVEALAASEPTYRLPRATSGHTRHYMPIKGWKNGVQRTSLVIDAFVRPAGPLFVEWPAALAENQRDLLAQLLSRLGYLGRAESRVTAQLTSGDEDLPDLIVSTRRAEPDDEPVRLLAPIASNEYDTWRCDSPSAPDDLVAALHMDTTTLQRERWNFPPGARELMYWRPASALSFASAADMPASATHDRDDTALFALSTDKKRDVLPLMERALPTMALFRRALLSKVGDEQHLGRCPELTGKDDEGQPMRCGHRHAHFIPMALDARNPRRIDHVLIHAPMGFGPLAERGLRRLRRTWAKGMDDIAVTLIGIGKRSSFRFVGGEPVAELGSGATWVSRTPFVPPRFLKSHGRDSLEEQICAELERRGLPALAAPPSIAAPSDANSAGREALWFRGFARTRQGNGGTPPGGVFHVTLTLTRRIDGPLCLGWGCHFGLGVFEPQQLSVSQSQ
jgi:CRISPR-associated protein Csb2